MTVFAAIGPSSMSSFSPELYLVFISVITLILMFTNGKKRWESRAHRLARRSTIDLPGRLEVRIANRLRNEFFVWSVFYPLWFGPMEFFSFNRRIQGTAYWNLWFPRLAILLPIFGVVVSFSGVIVARWNVTGPTRLSHLRKVRLRQAFTVAERCTLVAGVSATVGVSAWGLAQSHSSVHWWMVEFGTLALAGALWWLLENAVLDSPTTASDPTELEWDNLFRFRRVRSFAIGATWFPAMFGYVLDFEMRQQLSHFTESAIWVYGPLAVGTGVYLIFRQGRHLWRMA